MRGRCLPRGILVGVWCARCEKGGSVTEQCFSVLWVFAFLDFFQKGGGLQEGIYSAAQATICFDIFT